MIKYYDVNRLGRDLMNEFFDKKGIRYKIRYLESDEEYYEALQAKILEEVRELMEAEDEDNFLEEMADVVEVFRAILKLKNISWQEFEKVRKAKLKDRGGFGKRLFIDQLSEADGRDAKSQSTSN